MGHVSLPHCEGNYCLGNCCFISFRSKNTGSDEARDVTTEGKFVISGIAFVSTYFFKGNFIKLANNTISDALEIFFKVLLTT
jgi:hypothetical protein